jgi:branched-chain amino acid transport system ATP-binding protein
MVRSIRTLKGEGLSCCCANRTCISARPSPTAPISSRKGQIRFGGTMAELAANASLREQYLSV